jgi:hypothetical protein
MTLAPDHSRGGSIRLEMRVGLLYPFSAYSGPFEYRKLFRIIGITPAHDFVDMAATAEAYILLAETAVSDTG